MDTLDESLELFKKIVMNYDSSHDVFVLKNGQLNTLICDEGLEFIHNDFRILLINENVKYKFYITPLDDFFTDDKVIQNTIKTEIEKTNDDIENEPNNRNDDQCLLISFIN